MSSAAATADAGAAPKKKSKKLLIIILAVVLLLAGGGGAAFFMLKKKGADAHHDGEKAKPAKKDPSVFAPLDPFTVNLNDPGREHYLQIGLTYEVASADVGDALKNQMPLIRSRVLLLLTSKSADELGSPQGKSALANDLVALARGALANSPAPGAQNAERGVIDVHFSSFIIQ
jgi:flagellar FliL protein